MSVRYSRAGPSPGSNSSRRATGGLSSKRLGPLPELIFEVSDELNLKAATEAGLAEVPESEMTILRLVTNYPGCGVTFLTERTRAYQANVSATVRTLVAQALRDLDALRTVWLNVAAVERPRIGLVERAAAKWPAWPRPLVVSIVSDAHRTLTRRLLDESCRAQAASSVFSAGAFLVASGNSGRTSRCAVSLNSSASTM